MSDKIFEFDGINFRPAQYHLQLSNLSEVNKLMDDITDGKYGSSHTESSLTNQLRKEGSNSISYLSNVQSEIFEQITLDYMNKFHTYVALAKNQLTENIFPFEEWKNEVKRIEEFSFGQKVILYMDATLEGIYEVNKSNPKLSLKIMANFLSSNIDKNAKNPHYYSFLDFTINKLFPGVNFAKILQCSSTDEFKQVLLGGDIDVNSSTRIIDAGIILFTPSCHDCKDFHEAFDRTLSLESEYATLSGFRKKCRQFYNGDIWKTISKNDHLKSKFARNIVDNTIFMGNFFSVSKNLYDDKSKIRLNEVKDGMLTVFFDEVIKDDSKIGFFMLDLIEKEIPHKIKNQFLIERKEVEKTLSYHSLHHNLEHKDRVVNKIKI